MTPEQEKKLTTIEGKLLDVFLEEADPDAWAQVNPEADKEEQQKSRGDRYWQAKVANQTMALLTRIVAYRIKTSEAGRGGKDASGDDDAKHARDMKEAEKKVKGRLALVKKRAC